AKLGWVQGSFVASNSSLKALSNNVFTGFAYDGSVALIAPGAAGAGNNCFFNPDATNLSPYGNGTTVVAGDVKGDPKFAPRVIPAPISDGDVWRRRLTVSQILATYRSIYKPGGGSSLAGAASDGGNIGAIGTNGPDDLFGKFGP